VNGAGAAIKIVGKRDRYRLLEIDRLVEVLGLSDRESLAEIHRQRIDEAIRARQLTREGIWTESIAVGSEAFLREIASRIKIRMKLKMARTIDGAWYVSESPARYAKPLDSEIGVKKCC
jgi:putative transposase